MLIKVKKLLYEGSSYGPSVEEAVLNTDYIVTIIRVSTRRSEPCVEVRFADGVPSVHCVGNPLDFGEAID